jgi:hypothetical protein
LGEEEGLDDMIIDATTMSESNEDKVGTTEPKPGE